VRRREIVEVVEVRNTTRSKSKCAGASLFPATLDYLRALAPIPFCDPTTTRTSTCEHHRKCLLGTSPNERHVAMQYFSKIAQHHECGRDMRNIYFRIYTNEWAAGGYSTRRYCQSNGKSKVEITACMIKSLVSRCGFRALEIMVI
jgi:hypothetical protein